MGQAAERSPDYTSELKVMMKQAQVNSFRELSESSGVPRSQLLKMRRGQLARIPWESFAALAKTLKVPIEDVLRLFGLLSSATQEQKHQSGNEGSSVRQWQREGLDILESLMLQLPTASFAAQNNPTAPAVRLLPLLNPLDRLLESWTVERIGMVGKQIAFDPQCHQWIGPGETPKGESLVKVRYVGYRHGDRLLHRAKVGPIG